MTHKTVPICDHDWNIIEDYMGDPDAPCGQFFFRFARCSKCGAENHNLSERHTSELAELEREIRAELGRAAEKFSRWPDDPIHATAVIIEEAGETMKAALEACYEPHKSGPDHVRAEAIQTAAMCLRFLLSLDRYKFEPGQQHDAPIPEPPKVQV